MPRASYFQRLVAGGAHAADALTPVRLLFPPRSSLPEAALPALHQTSFATAPAARDLGSSRDVDTSRGVDASRDAGAAAGAESPMLSSRTFVRLSAAEPAVAAAPAPERVMPAAPPSHRSASGATAATPPPRPEQLGAHQAPVAGASVHRPAAAVHVPAPAAISAMPQRQAPARASESPAPIAPTPVELTPPPTPPRRPPRESATGGSAAVHIGHLEVRIVAPPSPPARPPAKRTAPRPSPARLARGFRSFGLAQI
jgi:hypothetical protein